MLKLSLQDRKPIVKFTIYKRTIEIHFKNYFLKLFFRETNKSKVFNDFFGRDLKFLEFNLN